MLSGYNNSSKDPSTRKQLQEALKDFASLSNNLFENIRKPNTTSGGAQSSNFEVENSVKHTLNHLIAKDQNIKQLVEIACNQYIEKIKLESYDKELLELNELILSMQKYLSDAERLLEQKIHEAKQKLLIFDKANETSIDSEEIITYSHRISHDGVLGAPVTWQGIHHPERPYPTDIAMRSGVLGRMANMSTPVLAAQQTGVAGKQEGHNNVGANNRGNGSSANLITDLFFNSSGADNDANKDIEMSEDSSRSSSASDDSN